MDIFYNILYIVISFQETFLPVVASYSIVLYMTQGYNGHEQRR